MVRKIQEKNFFTKTIGFRTKATISLNVQFMTGQLLLAFTVRTFFSTRLLSLVVSMREYHRYQWTAARALVVHQRGFYTFSDFFSVCVV